MKTLNGMYGMMVAAVIALAGCSNDSPNSPVADAISSEDAAESITSSIGQDNGGAIDQIADLSDIASATGIQQGEAGSKGAPALASAATLDTSYDAGTGTWTVTLSRERGAVNGNAYAKITRTYQYQLLNKNGVPQKYWRVPAGGAIDTAYSMTFTITGGTGEHHTPHLSQKLTAIGGSWTATGLNTSTITINGTYNRSAVDTLTTRNAVRTLENTITLTFTNIQVPRGNRTQMAQAATGTISGTYTANVTFSRGALYSEKTINRDFTVTLDGGNGNIKMGSKAFVGLIGSGVLKG